ncbi:hypothetical protein ACPOL_0804 [Acidisarcina polymorpha]|uniref:Uncharacterized protein n=1 Tax=Acidisarcina polymorpha TaxID=2211140 RepID=A0A2Z5FUY6_9BACT|nr:hypothetical protein ACPOL_0804 [Acidisarcina polymorpha]
MGEFPATAEKASGHPSLPGLKVDIELFEITVMLIQRHRDSEVFGSSNEQPQTP